MSNDSYNPPSREQRLDQVLADYMRAVEKGLEPDKESLIAQHAEFAADLEEFFADRERFDQVAGQIQLGTGMGPEAREPHGQQPDTPVDEQTIDSTSDPMSSHRTKVPYFGDYELIKEVARGGMGVVYKARQVSLNRIVALKMILAGELASENDVRRFHAEAEAAANLDHPGIVPIYEVGEHEGQHFFSMGFVEGQTLAAKIADGPLEPNEAARIVKAVAEAIQYAHDKGVIHRDLKPGNVLLKRSQESRREGQEQQGQRTPKAPSGTRVSAFDSRPLVSDFGLAKRVEGGSDLTVTGQVLGTPSYMPPEQAAGRLGQIGPASDIYSLGAVLYAAITGHPPFQAANLVDTLTQVLEQEPVAPRVLNPQIPRDLETITLRCLEKDARRRYASAQEMVDELQRFLNGEPILARPVSVPNRFLRWCKRRPLVAGLGATVTILALFVAIASPLVALRQVALRKEADDRANEVREAHEKTEITLVDTYTSAGLIASERGEPAQAALWFANAARLSNSDPKRRRANRIRVNTWVREIAWPVCVLEHSGQQLRSIQFHVGGRYLATRTEENVCTVWDLETASQLPLPGGERPVRSVTFSPNGQWLVLGLVAGNVDIYSFPAGSLLHRIEHRGPIEALVFSRDGTRLAIASNVVRVWDCPTHDYVTPELVHPQQVLALTFSLDGERLLTGCTDNQARVFAIEGRSGLTDPLYPPVRHRLRAFDWCIPISPQFIADDHFLLTVTDGRNAAWRDATTGEQIRGIASDSAEIHFLVVSPDERHFALGGYDRACIWSIAETAVSVAIWNSRATCWQPRSVRTVRPW